MHKQIKGKTAAELISEGYRYHFECRRVFNREYSNLKRRKEGISNSSQPDMKKNDLTRGQALIVLLIKLFVCSAKRNEKAHDIQEDSKDKILKDAFEQRPDELCVYHIRSMVNGALDSTAGELKYHQTCWNRIIIRPIKIMQSSQKFTMPTQTFSLPAISIKPSSKIPTVDDMQPDQETARYIAMSEVLDYLVESIKNSLSKNQFPTIREVVEENQKQLDCMAKKTIVNTE